MGQNVFSVDWIFCVGGMSVIQIFLHGRLIVSFRHWLYLESPQQALEFVFGHLLIVDEV
jgi:hypothetical protein